MGHITDVQRKNTCMYMLKLGRRQRTSGFSLKHESVYICIDWVLEIFYMKLKIRSSIALKWLIIGTKSKLLWWIFYLWRTIVWFILLMHTCVYGLRSILRYISATDTFDTGFSGNAFERGLRIVEILISRIKSVFSKKVKKQVKWSWLLFY